MKSFSTLLAFAAFIFSSFNAVAQKQGTAAEAFIGTWQLVSATWGDRDSTSGYDSSTVIEYRVITPNWFMYTIFQKKTNTFIGSSCGKLTIIGDQMTNTAEYSSLEGRKGVTNTYTVEVKGNIMHQKGKYSGVGLEETWVRLY